MSKKASVLPFAPRLSSDPNRYLVVPDTHEGLACMEDALVFFLYQTEAAAADGIRRLNLPAAKVMKAAKLKDIKTPTIGMVIAGTVSTNCCVARSWNPVGEITEIIVTDIKAGTHHSAKEVFRLMQTCATPRFFGVYDGLVREYFVVSRNAGQSLVEKYANA